MWKIVILLHQQLLKIWTLLGFDFTNKIFFLKMEKHCLDLNFYIIFLIKWKSTVLEYLSLYIYIRYKYDLYYTFSIVAQNFINKMYFLHQYSYETCLIYLYNHNLYLCSMKLWVSLVAQLVKNPPAMWETWVWPLGWKIPWRRERLPTPVFWPGEVHGLCSPWGRKESDTTERLSLLLFNRIVDKVY